jgi:hypothetical protein
MKAHPLVIGLAVSVAVAGAVTFGAAIGKKITTRAVAPNRLIAENTAVAVARPVRIVLPLPYEN